MKRLERRQDEIGEALSVLPRMSDALAVLVDQQTVMAEALRRLEARG